MKFSRKQQKQFSWDGIDGWVYSTKEQFEAASSAYIEVTGAHGKVKNTHSNIVYFVVAGKGEFFVEDTWFDVKKDDVVIIPKDTPYDFRVSAGVLKVFLVHTPAFDPQYDIRL